MPPKKKPAAKTQTKKQEEKAKPIKVTKKITKPATKVPAKKQSKVETKPAPKNTKQQQQKKPASKAKAQPAKKAQETKSSKSNSKIKEEPKKKETKTTKNIAKKPAPKKQPAQNEKKSEKKTVKEDNKKVEKKNEKKPAKESKTANKKQTKSNKAEVVKEKELGIEDFADMNQRQQQVILQSYTSYTSTTVTGRGQRDYVGNSKTQCNQVSMDNIYRFPSFFQDLQIPKQIFPLIFSKFVENLDLESPPHVHNRRFMFNQQQAQDRTVKYIQLNFNCYKEFDLEYGESIIKELGNDDKIYVECKTLKINFIKMDFNKGKAKEFEIFFEIFSTFLINNFAQLNFLVIFMDETVFQCENQEENEKLEEFITQQLERIVGHLPQLTQFQFVFHDTRIKNEELQEEEEEQKEDEENGELEIEETKKQKKQQQDDNNNNEDDIKTYFIRPEILKNLHFMYQSLWQNPRLNQLFILLPYFKNGVNINFSHNSDNIYLKIDRPQYLDLLQHLFNKYPKDFQKRNALLDNQHFNHFGQQNNNQNQDLVVQGYNIIFKDFKGQFDKNLYNMDEFVKFFQFISYNNFSFVMPDNNNKNEIFDNQTVLSFFRNQPTNNFQNFVTQERIRQNNPDVNFEVKSLNYEIKFNTNCSRRNNYLYNHNQYQEQQQYQLDIKLFQPELEVSELNMIQQAFESEELLHNTRVINLYLFGDNLEKYEQNLIKINDYVKNIDEIYQFNIILNEHENDQQTNYRRYFRYRYRQQKISKKQQQIEAEQLEDKLNILLNQKVDFIYELFDQIPNLQKGQIKVYNKTQGNQQYMPIFTYNIEEQNQLLQYECEVLTLEHLQVAQKLLIKMQNSIQKNNQAIDELKISDNRQKVIQKYKQKQNLLEQINQNDNNRNRHRVGGGLFNNPGIQQQNIGMFGLAQQGLFGQQQNQVQFGQAQRAVHNNQNQGLFGQTEQSQGLFGENSKNRDEEIEVEKKEEKKFDVHRKDLIKPIVQELRQIQENISFNLKVNIETKISENIDIVDLIGNLVTNKQNNNNIKEISITISEIAILTIQNRICYLNIMKGVLDHNEKQNIIIFNIFSYLMSVYEISIYHINFPRHFYDPIFVHKELFSKYPETLLKIQKAKEIQFNLPNLKDSYDYSVYKQSSEIFKYFVQKEELEIEEKKNKQEIEIEEKKQQQQLQNQEEENKNDNNNKEENKNNKNITFNYEESQFSLQKNKLIINMKKLESEKSQFFTQLTQFQSIIDNIYSSENIQEIQPIQKLEIDFNLKEFEDIVQWFQIFKFSAFTAQLKEISLVIAEFDSEHYNLLRKLLQNSKDLEAFNVKIVHKPERDPTKKKVVKKVTKKTRHKVHEKSEEQEEEVEDNSQEKDLEKLKQEFIKSEEEKSLNFLGNLVPIIQNSENLKELSFDIKGVKQGEIYLTLINKINEHTKKLPNLTMVSLGMEDQPVTHMKEITEKFLKTFHKSKENYFKIKFNILDISYLKENDTLELRFAPTVKDTRSDEFKEILKLAFIKVEYANFTVFNASKNHENNPTKYVKKNKEKNINQTSFTFELQDQNNNVSEREIQQYLDVFSYKSLELEKLVIKAPITDSLGVFINDMIENNLETLLDIDIFVCHKQVVIPHPDDLKNIFTNLKKFIERKNSSFTLEESLLYEQQFLEMKKNQEGQITQQLFIHEADKNQEAKEQLEKKKKKINFVFNLFNVKTWRSREYQITYQNGELAIKNQRNNFQDIKVEKQLIQEFLILASAKADRLNLRGIHISNIPFFSVKDVENILQNKEFLHSFNIFINQNYLHGLQGLQEVEVIEQISRFSEDLKNIKNFQVQFQGHQFGLSYQQYLINIIKNVYKAKVGKLIINRTSAQNQNHWGLIQNQNFNERIDVLKKISQQLEVMEENGVNSQVELNI